MSKFIDALTKLCQEPYRRKAGTPLLNYVLTGDEAPYKLVVAQYRADEHAVYFLCRLLDDVGTPDQLHETERRAISAGVDFGGGGWFALWLHNGLAKNPIDDEAYLKAFLEAFGDGDKARVNAAVALMYPGIQHLERANGQPNAAGRYLLSLSDAALCATGDKAINILACLRLLVRHAPQRLPALAESFVTDRTPGWRGSRGREELSVKACRVLLEHDRKQFESTVLRAIEAEKSLEYQARGLEVLAEFLPDKYQRRARDTNLRVLAHDRGRMTQYGAPNSFRWLLRQYGEQILPELESHLSSYDWHTVAENLKVLADELGPAGTPGMLAALRHSSQVVKATALGHLIDWKNPVHDPVILEGIRQGLPLDDYTATYITLASFWHPDRLQDDLWKLFDHRSKPIRHAAARALARMGDDAVPTACEKLAAKKAAVRSAAVTLLTALETPAAADALESRLDAETDEEVRDQILLALERVWETQGRKVTRKDIEKRMERAADQLGAPPAKWLAEKKLPTLRFAGKKAEPLSSETVRYLLYRQSRAREMRPDVEAKPLFSLIDRTTSGEFAVELLRQFLASEMAAEDRWALAVAALLGDDRIVPVLMQQIKVWVDKSRGKLAEYAAQALALLGTDVALCAVDALSIRYRSKNKNIGKAAGDAFTEAAERLGVSVEELGDRVVPWLGFEPETPRILGEGDKRIEVRIGPDFKLAFRDVVKGKPVKSLPAWVPATEKNEFKELTATLREVVKGQLGRLENLMVRQFRWPVARWRELYLLHPLLFPFACRLVWGEYGADGALRNTFRSLEDRTLTNERDETVELAADTQMASSTRWNCRPNSARRGRHTSRTMTLSRRFCSWSVRFLLLRQRSARRRCPRHIAAPTSMR